MHFSVKSISFAPEGKVFVAGRMVPRAQPAESKEKFLRALTFAGCWIIRIFNKKAVTTYISAWE
jgi:hypothetical protein